MHEAMRLMGLTDAAGGWYLWWSGIAGDLGMVTAGYVIWRRHNCHVRGCWRIQWRTHGEDALCRKHHPDDPPSSVR